MSGIILFLLPFIVAFIISLVNPDYTSILFTDPLGRILLYLGGVMMVAGALSIKKMVTIRI
jgi:tight adherence protein B